MQVIWTTIKDRQNLHTVLLLEQNVTKLHKNKNYVGLEVLVQLTNAEIAKSDVMIRVRIWNLTVVCEFNFSGLPLNLR
jgi:hypothetical protein